MARRRSFRSRRSLRVFRDRAWAVGVSNQSFEYTSVGGNFLADQATSLLTFQDLTPEESTLAEERSEWCIKRILLNAFWFGVRSNAMSLPPVRFVEALLGVFDFSQTSNIDLGATQAVVTGNVYNEAHRVLQTDTRCTYDVFVNYSGDAAGAGRYLAVGSGSEDGASILGPAVFGDACIRWDLKTNCRLRDGAALMLAHGPGLGAEFWDADDQMDILIDYRILAEKKQLK